MRSGAELRRLIGRGEIVVAPGVFSPSTAQLAQKAGFRALYFSGAAFANLLGLPDLGITTLSEVATAVRQITSVTDVPLIVDADTGFGEAVNVSRCVKELAAAGAAAIQIEDQVMPKRCGHLDGKEVVRVEDMVRKIASAKQAARGRVLIVARTDARSVEDFGSAVRRASAYVRAGADVIFPEALESRAEFSEFRKKIGVPLLANMTEFGKTPYTTASEFGEMGYNIVIFPVTAFRAMMKAVQATLAELKAEGTQREILKDLMTRDQVNALVGYSTYERLDRKAHDSAGSRRKKVRTGR